MATDAVDGIGKITLNGQDMCITSWDAEEVGTENDTTSSCDEDGQSSDITNKQLVVNFEAFYRSSGSYHATGTYNLNLDATVDLEAYVGATASNKKYTITDGKVTAWKTSSRVKDKVKVTGTVKSQGASSTYTVPTS